MGCPPVSAGSSCRAFVRSLARAFIRAAVCLWPPWRLAPPRRRMRVSPTLTALLAHVMLAVVSQSRQHCSSAPTIATMPSRCCCDRHASAPRTVQRLIGLVGRPWLCDLVRGVVGVVVAVVGVVAARTRLAPYSSACPAALGSAPLSTSSSASSLAPLSESSSRGGGDVIVLGIIHCRCERRLVNSRASGRLRRARRPLPRALMGIVVGFVVVGGRPHPPRRRLNATAAASTLPMRRATIITRASLWRRPLPRRRPWGHRPRTRQHLGAPPPSSAWAVRWVFVVILPPVGSNKSVNAWGAQ